MRFAERGDDVRAGCVRVAEYAGQTNLAAERLNQLRRDGALTDAEFERLKQEIV
jgi:hypothetical protein